MVFKYFKSVNFKKTLMVFVAIFVLSMVLIGCKKIELENVILDKENVELTVGEQVTVTATADPSDYEIKDITWSIDDPSVATVVDGKITAVKEGETTLKVEIGEKSASINVKVLAKKFNVSFNANGGSEINLLKVKDGEKAVEPTSPTKIGYTFEGWYKDSGLNNVFSFSNTIITEDIILYAKWKLAEYNVMFEENGGTEVAAIGVNHGNKINPPETPIKVGYTFKGWFINEDLSGEFNFETEISGSITLYAKWSLNEYVAVFEENGGSTVQDVTINHGERITEPEVPVKSGFTFEGWFIDVALKNQYNFATDVTEGVTLYAKWEPVVYLLSFELDGGSFVNEFTVTEYTVLTDAITIPAAVKPGHEFLGWFNNSEFSGNPLTTIPKGSMGDLKFFANFDIILHKVTFETNGGNIIDPLDIMDGEKLLKPTDPIKEGYNFMGWYKDSSITQGYDFNTAITADLKLYAAWEEKLTEYQVTLNWEYASKDEELISFLEDFYKWLGSKNIIDTNEMSFPVFSGKDKTGTGVDSKFIGEYIKYIGLSGDALGLGTEYFEGSVNHLRLQGPRDTAPNTINEAYFINSAQYNAKWAQYANFIHDETKLHTNRFWSENVGQYDMMRYVTGINASDPAYKKVDGKLDYFLGSYEMKFKYTKNSSSALPVITKHGKNLVSWNTLADGTGDSYTTLPVTNPVELELYPVWGIAKNQLLVDPSMDKLADEIFYFDGFDYKVGETAFVSFEDALNKLQEGYTLTLKAGTYSQPFAITVPNVIVRGGNGEKAIITNKITLTGTSGITFKNLEFTGLGQIYAKGAFDNFVFDHNNVYDSVIEASTYFPNNREDVNAFIQFYTKLGTNVIGNITITNNVFNKMTSDIISLDRTSVNKEIIITDNQFKNFGIGAIRFDGGYNNGTYKILRNTFENDELGGYAAIVFRAYSSSSGNKQDIFIEDNLFKNIGNKEYVLPPEDDATYPGSAVISTSVFNEKNVTISIINNEFVNNFNEIHFRNKGAVSSTWTVNINNNEFKGTQGYIYSETVDLADFNLNYYEDAEGNAITDLTVLATLIKTNTNYSNLGEKNN
ncbi:MAG TPA: hypothetical protein GX695_02685 [Acholeplasmataceae bacterium]|nr:hypothetical protein [Acholeplasmataceae bacterium]